MVCGHRGLGPSFNAASSLSIPSFRATPRSCVDLHHLQSLGELKSAMSNASSSRLLHRGNDSVETDCHFGVAEA